MKGVEGFAVSFDGTRIGYVTAGSGPSVLLVHGGMADRQAWAPIWSRLTDRFRVTAMDRRGRGASPDIGPYEFEREFDDVVAVAEQLRVTAEPAGGAVATVHVVGHSIGATCVLGAASRTDAFGRIVLYEPPGPATVPAAWLAAVTSYVAAGQPGRAMASFLQDRIGLSAADIDQLRQSPAAGSNWADIVMTTMVREGAALAAVDLPALARRVTGHVSMLLGAHSPPWCAEITADLQRSFPSSDVVTVTGHGHQAIIDDPDQLASHLFRLIPGRPPGPAALSTALPATPPANGQDGV